MRTGRFKGSWNVPHGVRISRGGYRFKGRGGQPTYKEPWPDATLLADWYAKRINEAEYTIRYNTQLAALSPKTVYDDLIAIGGGDAVLLCFENVNAGEFCHRRLVASWLEEALGIVVSELKGNEGEHSGLE